MLDSYQLARKVRTARVRARMSVKDLNSKIVMRTGRTPSKNFIYRLESGVTEPAFYVIEQIATHTRQPLTFFTQGDYGTTEI